MTGVPGLASDGLAAFVVATMPVFRERIPAAPARVLGRLAAPPGVDLRPVGAAQWLNHPAGGEPEWLTALRALGPLPVERLLGALELAVAGHDWSGAPDLLAVLPGVDQHLGERATELAIHPGGFQPPGARAMAVVDGQDSEALSAAVLLHQLHPGLADRTVALARELAAHPAVAPRLAVAPAAADEASIVALHGAAYLGLAVAVAGAAVNQAALPVFLERAAATVGLAVGTAALLLRDTPMPPAHAAALLAKARAEYVLPIHTSGTVTVAEHRFGLAEHGLPEPADFSGNGLVAVADGGIVVRAGVAQGTVRVFLIVLAQAPDGPASGWDEIVEVSWRAREGGASVVAPDGTASHGLHRQTPPWPGDYRVQVHARGRDELDAGSESYQLVVWAAPVAPEIVHKRTDRLGHRLRGKPEPARRPEHAYRWLSRSRLSPAATVTVVTGATVEQALRAFGAHPDRPESIDYIRRDLSLRRALDPWVAVLDAGDAVLVVEENGFRGMDTAVLRNASAGGRVASMFWNVNALTRLSFAEAGELLAAFEPRGHEEHPPEVAAALAGLDFAALGDRIGKGLVAVERFTGRGITAADLSQIRTADIGYRITE